jgi:hypothetical protein
MTPFQALVELQRQADLPTSVVNGTSVQDSVSAGSGQADGERLQDKGTDPPPINWADLEQPCLSEPAPLDFHDLEDGPPPEVRSDC